MRALAVSRYQRREIIMRAMLIYDLMLRTFLDLIGMPILRQQKVTPLIPPALAITAAMIELFIGMR